jgi:uncharacterized protein
MPAGTARRRSGKPARLLAGCAAATSGRRQRRLVKLLEDAEDFMDHSINPDQSNSRFETMVDGHRAVLDYRRQGDSVHMTHVGVPAPIEGRGIAAALTRAALDWARAERLPVVPRCPYVAGWIDRHPEYRALVADA